MDNTVYKVNVVCSEIWLRNIHANFVIGYILRFFINNFRLSGMKWPGYLGHFPFPTITHKKSLLIFQQKDYAIFAPIHPANLNTSR